MTLVIALGCGIVAGCGSGPARVRTDASITPVADTCQAGAGKDLGVASHPDEGSTHVAACSVTAYQTVPPSSGSHYPVWPVAKAYSQPVLWGFLMHALEHGAIVVGYNCPTGCDDEVAAVQAWMSGLTDPSCGDELARVILAPDPTLDVRWAASAWTWTLRACAFDVATFQQFFTEHYDQGKELICRSGSEIDWSSIGWCS